MITLSISNIKGRYINQLKKIMKQESNMIFWVYFNADVKLEDAEQMMELIALSDKVKKVEFHASRWTEVE